MKEQSGEMGRNSKFLIIFGVIFGIGLFSMIVRPFGYETTLTTWIDNWGTSTGWIIRGSMFLGGLVGVVIGMKEEMKHIPKDNHLPPNKQISNE